MSLSARIAVAPSRRLASMGTLVASGGFLVAAFTAVARWPDLATVWIGMAVVALGILLHRCRTLRSSYCTLSVTDRPEIALSPDVESGDGESWRLDDSTMMWPGFSVIALRRDGDALHGGRPVRWAVFDAELRPMDRRALHRFLVWSLRGGARSAAPASQDLPS